jgi:hypothetical protein
MPRSDARTPDEMIAALPPERREAISAVRDVIRANLPPGYEEGMQFGMLAWYVPLERFPDTYNGQPLGLAALASQKNYLSLYLNTVYGDPETERWFRERYAASGKKLDMGKSLRALQEPRRPAAGPHRRNDRSNAGRRVPRALPRSPRLVARDAIARRGRVG